MIIYVYFVRYVRGHVYFREYSRVNRSALLSHLPDNIRRIPLDNFHARPDDSFLC